MVVPRLVAAGDVGQVDFERGGHQLGEHLGAEPFFPPNFSAAGNCSTQLSTTANFLPGLALMLIVIILQNEQLLGDASLLSFCYFLFEPLCKNIRVGEK